MLPANHRSHTHTTTHQHTHPLHTLHRRCSKKTRHPKSSAQKDGHSFKYYDSFNNCHNQVTQCHDRAANVTKMTRPSANMSRPCGKMPVHFAKMPQPCRKNVVSTSQKCRDHVTKCNQYATTISQNCSQKTKTCCKHMFWTLSKRNISHDRHVCVATLIGAPRLNHDYDNDRKRSSSNNTGDLLTDRRLHQRRIADRRHRQERGNGDQCRRGGHDDCTGD